MTTTDGCTIAFTDWTRRTHCGAQPATEVRITREGDPISEWQAGCYQHAAALLQYIAASGYSLEERPPAILREVLDQTAPVIPLRQLPGLPAGDGLSPEQLTQIKGAGQLGISDWLQKVVADQAAVIERQRADLQNLRAKVDLNTPHPHSMTTTTETYEVPEELLELAMSHYSMHGRGITYNQLAAVLPEHERMIRKQVSAELEQSRRGGKELGKIFGFGEMVPLAELIKDAYLRGADDPIDALQMLGNCLAEVFENEGGLAADDHNRVYRALEGRRTELERLRAGLAEAHDALRRGESNKGAQVLEDLLKGCA
jgi:ribosome-binding protein aMBF1 (putative translation factor)